MTKKINGLAKWISIGIVIGMIVWNAIELHYNTRRNTAILQNDITHLTEDVADIKIDIKAINTYLLERKNP